MRKLEKDIDHLLALELFRFHPIAPALARGLSPTPVVTTHVR
jgi:hypothetical protein